jgi:hypothetical protein
MPTDCASALLQLKKVKKHKGLPLIDRLKLAALFAALNET